MPVCHLLSGLCYAMWYEQQTLLLSAHLSVQFKITITAMGFLEQKQTCGSKVFSIEETNLDPVSDHFSEFITQNATSITFFD